MDTEAEITFLGTGTSIGVPVIGCDCAVCRSGDPKNKRLRSSIHVRCGDLALVVDTGPDFRQQCLREEIENLDAVLFTHAHSDHIMGFDDLRRFTVDEGDFIDVFATHECLARLRAAFHYAFDGDNWYRGYLKPTPHTIDGPFAVGELEVTPLPVRHGKVETIGFGFERAGGVRFAYIPDAKTVSEETREWLHDVDVLILDGLQMEPHWTHLSIPEAVDLAGTVGAASTWLTHCACRVNYRMIEPQLPDNVRIAWDGLRIRV